MEEQFTPELRQALDGKIDRALDEAVSGKVYGPDEARRKVAGMRDAHLANLDR
jgi:hypothetical protein